MIRIQHLIQKSELFNWIENSEIVKVHIIYAQNKTLKNPNLVKLHAFHKISDEKNALHCVFSMIEAAVRDKLITNQSDKAFCTGIKSQQAEGFLSKGMVEKLLEIQDKYKVNFSIPKTVRTLIKQYDEVD